MPRPHADLPWIVRDPDITDAFGFLPFAQGRQVDIGIDEVMDLHQGYRVGPQFSERILHLFDTGVLAPCPDFGRDKQLVADTEFRRDVPTTVSELPYIGDESMTFPPRATNVFSTSSSGARAAGLASTSKVCQVPRPITGIASPDDGIRRVRSTWGESAGAFSRGVSAIVLTVSFR